MIKEIAKRANVSVSTVRRALNDFPDIGADTKARIRTLAEELGYRPNALAAAMITGKTKLIGVIVPELSNSFFPEIIDGLETAAHAAGYHILIAKHDGQDGNLAETIGLFNQYQVEGLCVVPASNRAADAVRKEIDRFDRPMIFFDEHITPWDNEPLPWMGIDDESAGFDAGKYLISHGHSRIAFAGYDDTNGCSQLRAKGLTRALAETKQKPPVLFRSPITEDGGRECARRIIEEKERPHAVLCLNDIVAAGLMLSLIDGGISVPGDISVMGFGNLSLGRMLSVPLTTVDQATHLLGERIMTRLLADIGGASAEAVSYFPAAIIERASVARKAVGI